MEKRILEIETMLDNFCNEKISISPVKEDALVSELASLYHKQHRETLTSDALQWSC